ncbi:hypothetical protein AYM40_11905 [Paraburkholderia phytofirmans OLGA172]|uniref:Purine-nucleoside phosphorylase n=1 Tax=Paraburkholderia phytofirmans OLGA172 TaxID=1417228 RepID=A0A160FPE0_9BURK|nr:DUF4148 domain-containing protein [Paraburkholderia phytofirmans]ANB74679.1 hypothetical protein AYM40_11905 [Paraburkholderia phytofirmans OLGA172]
MKSFTKAVFIAALIAAPVASFAQSSQSLSRAQVREELSQVESAGYNPRDAVHYPENIQAAEKKVAAQNAAAQSGEVGYGGATAGTSRSGHAPGL